MELLTVVQTAKLLRIHKGTLDRWRSKNSKWYKPNFPAPVVPYKPQEVMFSKDEIEAWLQSKTDA